MPPEDPITIEDSSDAVTVAKEEEPTRVDELRKALTALEFDHSSNCEEELEAYLNVHSCMEKASAAVVSAHEWKKEHPVTIADIAHFLRAPPSQTHPAGCCFLLENAAGDVARDTKGRPIIVTYGMVHGSAEELKLQATYVQNRVALYRQPGQAPGEHCSIIETNPRDQANGVVTFRFPDANVRELLDFMKISYPGSQISDNHICGIPRVIRYSFYLCKPFMSKSVYERLHLEAGFSHLKKKSYVEPSNLLKYWDDEGTFEFNLDEYIEWRAREEGVEDQLCPRGEGRSFDASDSASVLSTFDLLGEESDQHVIKKGWTQKQGSGKGMFGTTRWKKKFLVLNAHHIFYFEKDELSAENKAGRIIPLEATATVKVLDTSGVEAAICVHSAGRDFLFGWSDKEEASEWETAINDAIHAKVISD